PTAGELSEVFFSVAESTALPPKGPVAGADVSVLGAGWLAVTVVETELLAVLGSTAEELLMVAVFVMIVPLTTVRRARATSVMVAEAPLASEEKLTSRLPSVPTQTPPPVAAQETNPSVADGKLSATLNAAESGPLLVTVMV